VTGIRLTGTDAVKRTAERTECPAFCETEQWRRTVVTRIDLEHFRQELLALREEILNASETGDESASPVELDQSRIGRLSRMDAMQGQAMSAEMKRRRKASLQKIAGALERIDEGDFGTCEECGEQIATARLELDPSVTLCIRCATEAEQG
jgi:DnaK suppressor protein